MTVLKEEIYITLAYWLGQISCDVSVDRGAIDPECFNILVGFPYVDDAVIDRLAALEAGYAVFDVELLDDGKINYKPETAHWFRPPLDRLFRNAKAFLSYFEQSVQFMAQAYDLPVYKLAPACCPALTTHAPRGEADCDIDILFFGRVYDTRVPVLNDLADRYSLRLLDVGDVTTSYFRNDLAARSRIILHLGHRAPFQHIGMMRLLSMAHIGAFSLSEERAEIEPALRPLSAWWDAEKMPLVDCVAHWLAHPAARREQALIAQNAVKAQADQPGLSQFWQAHCAP
ncbi:hypothetical protein [Tateyamaria sp.]|uniref:hypothetical protein n=1 Tax=Tateyamaria sp. TaxID=1929288 RepID=UPI003B223310